MFHSHRGQRFERDLVIALRFAKLHVRRAAQQGDLERGEGKIDLEFLREDSDALGPLPPSPAIQRPSVQLD